jgi:hypothetical protein
VRLTKGAENVRREKILSGYSKSASEPDLRIYLPLRSILSRIATPRSGGSNLILKVEIASLPLAMTKRRVGVPAHMERKRT